MNPSKSTKLLSCRLNKFKKYCTLIFKFSLSPQNMFSKIFISPKILLKALLSQDFSW